MKVIVVFECLLASGNFQYGRHLFKRWKPLGYPLHSFLLREMHHLMYIRYLLLDQVCYKSTAGLLQVVRFRVCNWLITCCYV